MDTKTTRRLVSSLMNELMEEQSFISLGKIVPNSSRSKSRRTQVVLPILQKCREQNLTQTWIFLGVSGVLVLSS